LRIGIVFLWIAAATLGVRPAQAITFDGEITYTTDYIFRGISQTGGRSAGQVDLRAGTRDGTFIGVFASTLNRLWRRPSGYTGYDYELQAYLGHRFDLSQSWSVTVTATDYAYLKGNTPFDDSYQEISLSASYLDLWTVELAAIPNAVRFDHWNRYGRYPAYVASTSIQYPLVGRLALTGGGGYYTVDEDGYAYGNAGLAFEFKSFRAEAGYYVAQDRARSMFPYGRTGSRFAATVSWHF
jgi:uncharacterized protein (TIGR02001 family)